MQAQLRTRQSATAQTARSSSSSNSTSIADDLADSSNDRSQRYMPTTSRQRSTSTSLIQRFSHTGSTNKSANNLVHQEVIHQPPTAPRPVTRASRGSAAASRTSRCSFSASTRELSRTSFFDASLSQRFGSSLQPQGASIPPHAITLRGASAAFGDREHPLHPVPYAECRRQNCPAHPRIARPNTSNNRRQQHNPRTKRVQSARSVPRSVPAMVLPFPSLSRHTDTHISPRSHMISCPRVPEFFTQFLAPRSLHTRGASQ
jgi:hypothetical protein